MLELPMNKTAPWGGGAMASWSSKALIDDSQAEFVDWP
jgi:hypothetical protein